jgi:hypothetical protein
MIKSKEEVENTLRVFKSLDLSDYPVKKIRELIFDLGAFPTPAYTLHPGKRVVRARLNRDGEPFVKKSDVNYVPADCNKEYQRASTPDQNMFYGSVLPEELSPEEVKSERITTACETSELWNKKPKFIKTEVLTFSSWIVKEDIPLVAVIDPNNPQGNQTKLSQDLHKMFWDFVNSNKDKLSHTVQSTQFFADEFSKEVSLDAPDYSYLITAVLTNNIVNGGTAGMLYPSVKTSAKSMNIALSPEFADRCLELDMVLHCKMYKLKKYAKVNNELIATNIDNADSFTYTEITNPKHNVPEDQIIKELEAAT